MQLLSDVERGASLRRKFIVAMHRNARIIGMERLDERAESGTLRRSSGVFRCLAVGRAPTDITDSDRVRVVSGTVRPNLRKRTPLVDRAIAINYEVIADVGEISGEMPLANMFNSEILPSGVAAQWMRISSIRRADG